MAEGKLSYFTTAGEVRGASTTIYVIVVSLLGTATSGTMTMHDGPDTASGTLMSVILKSGGTAGNGVFSHEFGKGGARTGTGLFIGIDTGTSMSVTIHYG